MKGFDKHLHELLEAHPEAALEHAKRFAELPLSTQLAIMRRRRKLSQKRFMPRGMNLMSQQFPFYKYTPPCPLPEIKAHLKRIEKEIADMIAEVRE